ncbi:MAG: hypothetical protein V4702_02185 [Patescibacteria group bacterium]
MPRYYRESTYHRQIRFIRIIRRLVLVIVTILFGIGAFISYDTWRASKQASRPSATTAPSKSTFVSSLEIYRTQYFQFQASKTWRAIANESTATKFMYRKFNSNLVEAQLAIYVNEPADKNIDANRVLPVTFSPANDKLNALFVSDHCGKDAKEKGYKMVKLQDVTFRCLTDSADYSLLIGKEGGTTKLEMVRADGTLITYVIHFRDLRAIADAQDIEDIVNSFQVR